jgi:hypothetical protein
LSKLTRNTYLNSVDVLIIKSDDLKILRTLKII